MDRKKAILDAAAALFAERGFAATPTAEIARRAGVAEGTIFHHFKNKDELLFNIVIDLFDAFIEGIKTAIATPRNGLDAVEKALWFHLLFIEKKSSLVLVLVRDFPFKLLNVESPFSRELKTRAQRIHELFVECLERGRQDGSICPVSIQATAIILRSLLTGYTRLKFLSPVPLPEMREELIRFCRRSLTTSTTNHEQP
ncbi:MAG: TetR/AcrR family transcriptional regulator [Deltaproteobacteria bacterium]|nr:TetR/AcrR family transcriptional regulator [Deltaproteobacteria bacterium]